MDATLPSLFKVCWKEISLQPGHDIQAFTDNQSLHDAVKTNIAPDWYLWVEISALMLSGQEWNNSQLDC